MSTTKVRKTPNPGTGLRLLHSRCQRRFLGVVWTFLYMGWFLRGSLGRGTAGDYKGPPNPAPPPSPLQFDEEAFQKPTRGDSKPRQRASPSALLYCIYG